jgi:uncharacterized protein
VRYLNTVLMAVTALGSVVLGSTLAPAAEVAGIVKECDRLTAPNQNADPAAPGVKNDWGRAVVACEAAIKIEPSDPHFQFALGKAYFFVKNYFEAVRHFKIAADAGIPDAQNVLGYCFSRGLGVVKNDRSAFELFNTAAAAGSPTAMASLGGLYSEGLYVKRDYGKALDWLEKSIEAGNEDALQQIGNMYFNGQGVPKDYAIAAQYFQQAADLNNGYALRFLASMYEVGLVGKPDLEKAGALRARAQQVDPDGRQPEPISFFRQVYAASQSSYQSSNRSHGQAHAVIHRRYVLFRRRLFFGCNWLYC